MHEGGGRWVGNKKVVELKKKKEKKRKDKMTSVGKEMEKLESLDC